MENEDLLRFSLAGANWRLSFSKACIELLESRMQRRWHQRESVGQLFSHDLTLPTIFVDSATVLTPTKSSRTSVTLDPNEAVDQRSRMLGEGLYCIGLWHTHPEMRPAPSSMDERLAADHALAARSVLNGLCFVIVGTKPFPDGWYVGVHDGATFRRADSVASD